MPTNLVRTAYRASVQCAAVALAAAMLVLTGCGSSARVSTPPTSSDPSSVGNARVAARIGSAVELRAQAQPAAGQPNAVAQAAAADEALALTMLNQQHTSSDANVSVSPASLSLALAMLQNGARGATQAGIAKALHTSMTSTELDAGWSALVKQWAAAAVSGGFALHSANSLWLAPDVAPQAAFLSALATYFDTGVWRVAFGGSGAARAINSWTTQQTHGVIRKLFDQLPADTQAVLANAVYFKAGWELPFDPADTAPGTFTTGTGATQLAQFMSETAMLQVSATSGYQAAQLPYRGGRFAALVIMPRQSKLGDYVQHLNAAALTSLVRSLHATRVQLTLPKFTTTSTLDLVPTLSSLGMADAFSGAADFSALSAEPLQLSQVVQRVYLKVGEKGTEAAAVTGISATSSAREVAPASIRFDHPFLFLIRDTTTGAILFASEINAPTA